jgi:hypothetical protein
MRIISIIILISATLFTLGCISAQEADDIYSSALDKQAFNLEMIEDARARALAAGNDQEVSRLDMKLAEERAEYDSIVMMRDEPLDTLPPEAELIGRLLPEPLKSPYWGALSLGLLGIQQFRLFRNTRAAKQIVASIDVLRTLKPEVKAIMAEPTVRKAMEAQQNESTKQFLRTKKSS